MNVLSTQSSPYLIHAYDKNITVTPGILIRLLKRKEIGSMKSTK